MIKVFFKRGTTSENGLFTIQEYDGAGNFIKKHFDQIPARSGDPHYFNREWISGKSPIPRSGDNFFWLSTRPNHKGVKPGARGIGECFPISSDKGGWFINESDIGPMPVGSTIHHRTEIMLHCENLIPGSAGCIVITHQSDFDKISDFLQTLGKTQKLIPLKVI